MNIFQSLGYQTKQDYMKGEHYKDLKALCLEQHPKCQNCSADATDIFFLEYNHGNIRAENTNGVLSLCKNCLSKSVKATNAVRKKGGKKKRRR